MSRPVLRIGLRLRLPLVASAAVGLVAVLLMVGALFPAVGSSIGKLNLPSGVAELLGGADYGTLTGWYQSEIAAVYGPLIFGAVAITGAAAATAGDEEAGILAVVLAHPLKRSTFVLSNAIAITCGVILLALATWVGLIAGVALGGGGIAVINLAALSVHLIFFGLASGSVALALGAGTGRRGLAIGGAAGFAILGYLINGFAPLIGSLGWLKYLSPFYYYATRDPLSHGFGWIDLLVLGLFTITLTLIAMGTVGRRDLR